MPEILSWELYMLVMRVAIRLGVLIFVFVVPLMLWRNDRFLSQLLIQGQNDKRAREQMIMDLRTTADELSLKTAEILAERNKTQDEQFNELSKKIDVNTEITARAADASVEAARIANSVDEKIANGGLGTK